ncbi:purine-binding chemotaxis protein CheW [Azospirillaceae bacterium]
MAVAQEKAGASQAPATAQTSGALGGESETSDARQFVIFFVRGESFAVPLAEVQEIIRMPDVVRLPLSSPALEGLANLRGSVLPILNLRCIFGFEQAMNDDATRVVVLDQGQPIGLIVDRMANVVTVENEQIEAATRIQNTVDTDLVAGMIKNVGNQTMVMILDTAKLVGKELRSAAAKCSESGNAVDAGREPSKKNVERSGESDEMQLVSFEVDGQEYALPIEHVQEIVQVPETLMHMPNVQSYVLGVMSLRNRLLPLVSLRDLFGLKQAALGEHDRIVVVSMGGGGGNDVSVGVVMDSVKEVLRVGRNVVDAVPPLLAKDGDMKDIVSICRLDGGKRLVSIIAAERLVHSSAARAAVEAIEAQELRTDAAMEKDGKNGGNDDEEQVVVFRLLNEEYGVPIEMVQEIVRVPDELTRVPHTPIFIEGVVNLRGIVLPVIDQRRRFGLPNCERNDRQRIMVFTIQGLRTGFIVDSVSEVMRLPRSAIGPAPNLSDEQQKLIKRVANLEKQKRMILLLNVEQLLGSQELTELKGRNRAA